MLSQPAGFRLWSDRRRTTDDVSCRQAGVEVVAGTSAQELVYLVAAPPFDGERLAGEIRKNAGVSVRVGKRQGAIVVMIAEPSVSAVLEAAQADADVLLPPSVTGEQLLSVIRGTADGAPCGGASWPSLARSEWEYMHAVLKLCGGNRSEAARRLGIHRSVLQRKLSRNPPPR
jgi:ActR/RegA family two-component response regulator